MNSNKYLNLIVPGLLWLCAPAYPMHTPEASPLMLAVALTCPGIN